MLQNVEYPNKPERFVYERSNGMAHITLSDNVRESVSEDGEDVWLCDLYTLVIEDTDNMTERLEKSYKLFLAKAKEEEAKAREAEANRELSTEERIKELEAQNEMLTECILELSELLYN